MSIFHNARNFIHAINPWGDAPDNEKRGGNPWGGGSNRGGGGKRGGGGGGNGGGPTPPDFDALFRQGRDRFKRAVPPSFGGGNIGWIIGVVVLGLWALSGVYSIAGGEQGVVLRFGKFDRTTPPGLHMHLPYPIETVIKANTGLVNQIDIGGTSVSRSQSQNVNFGIDPAASGQMLTQDKNILNMHFRISWRIDEPAKFLFNMRDPQLTIRAAGESVMRELVGQRTFDNIVRGGREQLGQEAREQLQEILNIYEAGVLVVDVLPQKIDPPAQVIEAFNDVQRAEQDAEREINQAEAYRSDIVPRARGEAERIKLDAQAYMERSTKEAEGEAQRFIQVYNAYRTGGELTKQRLYIETMQEIMQKSPKIFVDGKSGSNVLPFLPLQDLMNRRPASAAAAPATN